MNSRDDMQASESARLVIDFMKYLNFTDPTREVENALLAKMESAGSNIIPVIDATIQRVLQANDEIYGGDYKKVASLCEVIGKVGGKGAFEILTTLVTRTSKVWEYGAVREGAARGLAHLAASDERAAKMLPDLAAKFNLS